MMISKESKMFGDIYNFFPSMFLHIFRSEIYMESIFAPCLPHLSLSYAHESLAIEDMARDTMEPPVLSDTLVPSHILHSEHTHTRTKIINPF